MRMVVVWRPVRSPVSLMFMLNYLDDVADGVGEPDIVMITSVVASSSGTWCSSEKHSKLKFEKQLFIPAPCMLPLMQHRENVSGIKLISPEENDIWLVQDGFHGTYHCSLR